MLLPPAQDFLEAELDVKRGLCLQPENADLHVLSKRLKVREGWGGGRGEILTSRLAHCLSVLSKRLKVREGWCSGGLLAGRLLCAFTTPKSQLTQR